MNGVKGNYRSELEFQTSNVGEREGGQVQGESVQLRALNLRLIYDSRTQPAIPSKLEPPGLDLILELQ